MAGGRPRALIFIIETTQPTVNLINQSINHRSLMALTSDLRTTVNCLAEYRLISNSFNCDHCDEPCRFTSYTQSPDGLRWKCRDCNFVKTLRHGSFFSKSHLSLSQLLDFIYFWSQDTDLKMISQEARCNYEHTAIDWSNFLREICTVWVANNPAVLGGLDPVTLQPKIVEVDETKFFHRKYARGAWHEGHWVVGGLERGNPRNSFLVEVPNRTAVTLTSTSRTIVP